MSEASKTEVKPGHAAPAADSKGPVIHRVCTSCNGMFKVTMENLASKICPACHKG